MMFASFVEGILLHFKSEEQDVQIGKLLEMTRCWKPCLVKDFVLITDLFTKQVQGRFSESSERNRVIALIDEDACYPNDEMALLLVICYYGTSTKPYRKMSDEKATFFYADFFSPAKLLQWVICVLWISMCYYWKIMFQMILMWSMYWCYSIHFNLRGY